MQIWDDLELRPAVVWKVVSAAAAGQRAVTSHCFEINPSALEEASLICGLRALSGASSIYCFLVVPRHCAACYFLFGLCCAAVYQRDLLADGLPDVLCVFFLFAERVLSEPELSL